VPQRPSYRQNTSGKRGKDRRCDELSRSDPSSYARGELEIAHPHGAEKTWNPEQQAGQSNTSQAVPGA